MLSGETVKNSPINEELIVYTKKWLSHFKGAEPSQGNYLLSSFETVLVDADTFNFA